MRRAITRAALAGGLGAALAFAAHAQSLPSTNVHAVPTYESAGLYWASPGGTQGCTVRFRKAGTSAWTQGLDLWYDARDGECRGSLVHLAPGTDYEAQLGLPNQSPTRAITFRTWANQVPVSRTVQVAGGSQTLNITQGGSASGYVVYDGKGATLDGANAATHNVTINASYVVLRGFNLRGARQDAIRISPNVSDVIIEDNDISGWGRQRSGNWGVDMDSAVRAVCTSPTLTRVTIQRNKIHDPRYSANSWSDGHPAGPQAIAFAHCGGNHVFRHNEAYSTNGNYFNDIFGGEDNFTKAGFPNSDTDIYGNRLSHAWDDAIEAEGANENVRIWGNYIDRTAIGIATTATSVGPAYIFRNVWNRAQMYEKIASLDQDDRQPFFKSGGTAELGHGRRYVFHNTMLQARQSGLSYGLGGGFGLGGTGSAQLIENTWSRNNIYHQWKDGKGFTYQTGSTSSFVSDMYNGTAGDASVSNGIVAKPTYALGHGPVSEAGGQYQLALGTAGVDAATRIPNFNDAYQGAAPDVGAHESSSEAMKFGLAGSPGSVVGSATSTPPPASPGSYVLAISKAGSGSGTVTSAPAGISCGGACSASFTAGSAVSLSASAASGSTFAGWSGGGCTGTGMCTVTLNAATGVTATFNAASVPTGGAVSLSTGSLSFGGAGSQSVTYTNNTGAKVTFIQASVSSGRYGQANNCGEVAPGGSCTATLTYYPSGSGSDSATFTMTSTAPNSPHVVSLSAGSSTGSAAPTSLLPHFYRSILRRDPDPSGEAYWGGELTRLSAMGSNVNEVWFAMAAVFFASPEYASLGRDHAGFVSDLYKTFFNRDADASGHAYWTGQIVAGMPREIALATFMFSPEFAAFSRSFGSTASRVEVDMVMDLYRGLLARLPDASGFGHWLQQFRAAQCQGQGAVYAVMESMSSAFLNSPEYGNRRRASSQLVGDLYNALLRRGGDLNGVQFWIQQHSSGLQSANQIRRSFIDSSEVALRVDAIVAQGCLS
ncbi:MAG TPA: DUF4214 domain-containing protein [Usitatibacter sp.]|nr:DUF4214 domain-containing protein [Usitatibacter sp.]